MIRKIFLNNSSSSNNNNNQEVVDPTDPTESFRSFYSSSSSSHATPLHNGNTALTVHINSQESVTELYKQLKAIVKSNNKRKSSSISSSNSSHYNNIKSITMSFRLKDPYQTISHLKKLKELFVLMGSLSQLEQLNFVDADLMITNIYQLLKKSSSSSALRVLKFHNCTFVAVKKPSLANKMLWRGIQKYTANNLRTLELLGCYYTASDTLCRDPKVFVCEVPSTTRSANAIFQQYGRSSLQRLALDECIIVDNNSSTIASLFNNFPSLQELEIRPNFDRIASKFGRRQQYQAKKDAIHTLMTETIPSCLARNTTLTKLIVNLERYHMDSVYQQAMTSWIELLLEHNNCTLTEMRITPQRLVEEQQQQQQSSLSSQLTDLFDDDQKDDDCHNYYKDCPVSSCLFHDLNNMLRLNHLFGGCHDIQEAAMRMVYEQQQQHVLPTTTTTTTTSRRRDTMKCTMIIMGEEDKAAKTKSLSTFDLLVTTGSNVTEISV